MEVNKTSPLSLIIYVILVQIFLSAITSGNDTDRFALLAFKDRITSDPFNILSSWNDSFHHCSWTGITCSRRHQTRVIVLNLFSRGLVGSISPHIGNLTFLKILDLDVNEFSGDIPQEIGHLFRLQFLYLSNNSLQGEIPKNITSCTELRFLYLNSNELVGRIPPELGSLSNLVIFEVSNNYLEGAVPVSLSNLSALDTFSITSNNLHGSIPPELGKFSSLQFFQIGGNKLSGTIPPQLFNITSISLISIAANRLDGTIPFDIGITLPNLEWLTLGDNTFSGLLPSSISNASRLSILDVVNNDFTGPVTPNLGTLQDLVTFNIGGNHFGTGKADDLSFFRSLSNCSRLEHFSMAFNNLSGQLPDSMANYSAKLSTIYIGTNHIFGSIPSGLENLVSLNGLAMENNMLTGSIPDSIGRLSNLVIVSMWGNQLSGIIPSNICNSTQLEQVYFGMNNLDGQIPSSLGIGSIPKQVMGLSSLSVFLDLSWNLLTGTLPSEAITLEKIVSLDLSENQFSGKIPSSLGNCNFFEGIIPPSLRSLKGIQNLDLSRNRLSGRIPEFLESFADLKYLNLSSNDLEGQVPKQGIFKNISAFSILGNGKLCGGVPLLNVSSCPGPGSKKQSQVHFPVKRLLVIIFGAVIFVIFLGSILIFYWNKKAMKKSYLHISDSETPSDEMFQKVSFRELFDATNGFSVENLVGAGSYGSVYKGAAILSQESSTVVAVKVLNLERRGASKSFMAECEALRCIRHRNLVKIMTSCSSVDFKGNEFKALVFEFMPNGSLEDWLHPTPNNSQFQRLKERFLSFTERLNMATDIACALEYLHHHCQTPLVHCDLKPSNVLLDDEMNAHVGDFGLAKFLGGVIIDNESKYNTNSTSVGIRGSVGYAAPEYGMGSEVSTNGDVYSYGIILLEIFTGKRPTDDMFEDGFNLHSFGDMALVTDRVVHIVDPYILVPLNFEAINCEIEAKMSEALTRIIKLGVGCSANSPEDRMEMVQVVKELQSIKNMYLLDLDM
ncbi:hypothetical protein MKX03_031115 [Papaver bracteatum]|nr:hypothetical protein MKX03_031115 [Papaver bracteatum]